MSQEASHIATKRALSGLYKLEDFCRRGLLTKEKKGLFLDKREPKNRLPLLSVQGGWGLMEKGPCD